MLGYELYAGGRRSDALSELRQIRDVDPRQATEMYLVMARAAAALNEPKDAGRYAEEARKYAGRPEETTRVGAAA